MNVLEKILEEIEEKTILVATSKEHYNQPQNGKYVEEVITIKDAENIIRSHMNELPKCGDKRYISDRRVGCWKLLTDCSNAGVYCSVCGKKVYKESYANQKLKSKFCPNCGAKMMN